MSSIALRRLAVACRPTSSIYKLQRTFTTSSPLFTETNGSSTTTNATDAPRTVTMIPGKKKFNFLLSHINLFSFKVMVLARKFQIVFKKYLKLLMYHSIGNLSM
jgi:hypothetical protein